MSVIFPEWTNRVPGWIGAGAVVAAAFVVFVFWFYLSPNNLEVGYAPDQPVQYSHQLHAGQLGMDCRYCHQHVETGPHATIPTTETCMNCHKTVRQDSPEIQKVAAAHTAEHPVQWTKVHLLPDYAYFNHAAHVRVGVGCVSCHGRIDQMDIVRQTVPLSMGWCLGCHRDPTPHLRPPSEVTNMRYEHDAAVAERIAATVNPPTHCSACHR